MEKNAKKKVEEKELKKVSGGTKVDKGLPNILTDEQNGK